MEKLCWCSRAEHGVCWDFNVKEPGLIPERCTNGLFISHTFSRVKYGFSVLITADEGIQTVLVQISLVIFENGI